MGMSDSDKDDRRPGPAAPAVAGRGRPGLARAVLFAIAVVAAGGYWWDQARQTETADAFEALRGRWRRADGDYIIDIRNVRPGGQIDAAYFSPTPVLVTRAEASRDGGTVRIFIELQDLNSRGSTYALALDPRDDQLKGTCFQAAAREISGVSFMRLRSCPSIQTSTCAGSPATLLLLSSSRLRH